MQYLAQNKVSLPSGYLTPFRFQELGIVFGFHGKTLLSNNKSLDTDISKVVSILCMVSQS